MKPNKIYQDVFERKLENLYCGMQTARLSGDIPRARNISKSLIIVEALYETRFKEKYVYQDLRNEGVKRW